MQNTAGNKDDSVLPTFMVLRVFTLDPIICISSLILQIIQIKYTFKCCCHIKMSSSLNVI